MAYRVVRTDPPSFPAAQPDVPLAAKPGERWQVLCGDDNHWRCGVYSPAKTRPEQIAELEWHDCPELFLLMDGRVSLLLKDEQGERIVELVAGQPILVSCWHTGFCSDGPHTGRALVIERDRFETRYSERAPAGKA